MALWSSNVGLSMSKVTESVFIPVCGPKTRTGPCPFMSLKPAEPQLNLKCCTSPFWREQRVPRSSAG